MRLAKLSGQSRVTVKRTLIEVTGSSVEAAGILLSNTEHTAEIRDVQITSASSGTSGVQAHDATAFVYDESFAPSFGPVCP